MPTQERPVRLTYMPGLDGVRALAVTGVLLYHGDVRWLPGGFLGVDVFFALSGYLITSLLLAEFARGRHIDMRRFWAARWRRLLPAALLLIGVALLVTAIFIPGDLARARGDAIASALYVNNWHQIAADRSYFAAFGRPSLFQHLWSLAVEEQFYLVWPLLLAAGLSVLGRTRTIAATAVLGAGSALVMALVYRGHGDASRVYYGSDTRAFSLLAGALLAFAWTPERRATPADGRTALRIDAIGVVGLAVLAFAMLAFRDSDTALYPYGLLLVAAASVATIAAATHPATVVSRGLGLTPLRWIGQRSYGIYLWHWPVMTLSRPGIDVHGNRTLLLAAQLLVTLALAEASFRFLEMPVRRRELGPRLRGWLSSRPPRERLRVVAGVAVVLLALLLFPFVRHAPPEANATGLKTSATAAAKAKPTGRAPRTPTATTPTADDRPPLAVGASVMLAAAPALTQALPPGTVIDAAVGRQADDIIGRLQAYKDEGTLPSRVIVQIGENGPFTEDDKTRLRDVLKDVRRVVLLNVRVPRVWQDQSNAEISSAVTEWSNARLANWHGVSGIAGRLFGDDTHPNAEGDKAYVRVVLKALNAR